MIFASRAGEKLQFALDNFKIDIDGKTVADFGSSTGGFVDCLLQSGAKKVYSVDTAYGELAWKLRQDPRVMVMERTNAMHVILPEKSDIITVDTSWTKQRNVLPNVLLNLKEGGIIISLIKPHYEAGKSKLSDMEVDEVLEKVKRDIENEGLEILKMIESPILGEKGKNREFLFLLRRTEIS
jgi:23S rRNA (cytidine1920-2'-O)/16S rRNA (cytidine1409-2'-O)-methyltransferase